MEKRAHRAENDGDAARIDQHAKPSRRAARFASPWGREDSMTRWLSIAALALSLSSVAAEPLVKRNLVHYDVGTTAQEIRAEMDRLGPIDQMTKRRFDATTRWNVKWTYRYRNV